MSSNHTKSTVSPLFVIKKSTHQHTNLVLYRLIELSLWYVVQQTYSVQDISNQIHDCKAKQLPICSSAYVTYMTNTHAWKHYVLSEAYDAPEECSSLHILCPLTHPPAFANHALSQQQPQSFSTMYSKNGNCAA